ncbi:fimbrial protein [Lelliottia sp. SL45]|uniref:fimbrial protein n=1 Tax=Lelliottia sp. SL45 TaxID=2994665 RepID=UPI002276F3DB|nr:fimbrial protein [Lelliottia sp. SL45]MCY1700939.1 fimbrial protein [Lelliottia sp. SL45]
MTVNIFISSLRTIVMFYLFVGASFSTYAFTCKDSTGQELSYYNGNTTANVFVNLTPQIKPGQVLVVDLSQSISCRNDSFADPPRRHDYVSILQGTTFGGALNSFTGTLGYYGNSYNLPTVAETASYDLQSASFIGWDAQLYLTPISAASSVLIHTGEKIATIVMRQVGSNYDDGSNQHQLRFTWNIYANNSVFVPTGGCDVSARDVTVTLPDYPGTAPIPLTVYCAQNQNLNYYLSGTTVDAGNTVFANTASSSPAQGVGVQLTRNGTVVPANNTVSLGTVGTSAVSLGLTANYARTSGQVIAGNVQSIIEVTFVYQ